MHSRGLRIFLLAFCAVWFGAIVPGHRRGCIVVAGAARNVDTAQAESRPVPHCHRNRQAPASSEKQQPAPRGGGPCAICLFATTIEPPAAPDVAPRPVCTAVLEQWGTPAAAVVRVISWFDSRGPPTAC
jgi:hypothetical protein